MNEANSAYINHILSLLITGDSYYKFTPVQVSIIWGRIFNTVMLSFLSLVVFNLSLFQFKRTSLYIFKNKIRLNKSMAYFLLSIALLLGFWLFLDSVFPNIPDALGGGKAPLVVIEFKEGTPYTVTTNFDISAASSSGGFPYWARLVFMDNNSVFLQEAFWFSNDVYEVRKDSIELIRYAEHNPVEIGSPYLRIP